MFEHLKYVLIFPIVFLLLFGTLPLAVSVMYGGNPPPHIASVLDKQIDTWSAVARMIFGPLGQAVTPSEAKQVATQ